MTTVVSTVAQVRSLVSEFRRRHDAVGGSEHEAAPVVLVPTMGALHEGHLQLVRHARSLGGMVVVSIFVNPLQFGPHEDFDRYPRTLDDDVDALSSIADVVFAPSASEMYPHGKPHTRVVPGEVAARFEGAARPGHFDGVLTVVTKLLGIIQPDVAIFGQKDAQQVFLIGRMVADLNLPVSVVVAETVRESDGLALSSRNRYLTEHQRAAAVALSSALAAGAEAHSVDTAVSAAKERIGRESLVKLDYLAIVDPETFDTVGAGYRGSALMLIAARIGETRLIDNQRITLD